MFTELVCVHATADLLTPTKLHKRRAEMTRKGPFPQYQ